MTREEAIKYLSEEQKKTEEVVALTERDFGVSESVWHTEYEAFNLAISALREQEKLESKLRVFESNRIESDTVKGVEIDQFKNEPLTLEELQQMDWQPVWIPLSPPASVWALVNTSGKGAPVFTFPEGDQCFIEEWLAEVGPVYRREVPSL